MIEIWEATQISDMLKHHCIIRHDDVTNLKKVKIENSNFLAF